MLLNNNINPYLSGDQFSSELVVDIRKTRYPSHTREDIILDITKGKSVIHVGCSDHLGVIDTKIKTGKWLHKLLTDNCEDCLGIDLDEESIQYLIEDLGYTNVEQGDIIHDHFSRIEAKKWNYVLFGEIIEHLDNPVEFLSTFKSKYQDNVENFIITVPNILNKARFRDMKAFKEIINTDHRYWFTPYTISKVIAESGMRPDHIYYSNLNRLNTGELISRKLKKIFHFPVNYSFMYFNTLIITGNTK